MEQQFYRREIITNKTDFYLNERNRIIAKLMNPTMKVLDVGCGCGELLNSISDCELKVGVEISSKAVKAAKKDHNIFFIVGSATSLPFREASFNTIFCSEVLEHLATPQNALQEVKRIITQNGRFIVTVPNLVEVYGWLLLLLNIVLSRGDRRRHFVEYYRTTLSLNGLRSYHLGHLHVKPATSWRKMLLQNGFNIKQTFGILLLPLRSLIYSSKVYRNAKNKIRLLEDKSRYQFPMNYFSNGIGFITQLAD